MSKQRKKRSILPIIIVLILVGLVLISACIFGYRYIKNHGESDTSAVSATTDVADTATSAEQDPLGTVEDASYYQVINRSHPIPENYIAGTGQLVEVEGGQQLETKAGEAFTAMVTALHEAGLPIVVHTGYRSDDLQAYFYNNQINKQNGDERKAATISAVPLTSEHQAGLAIDLSVDDGLEATFADTETGQWLEAHCAEYGFILRYIPGKERITGIIAEPWHFRYVGSPELATDIMASGLCMEEYFNQYLEPEDIDPYLPYLP